MVMVITALTSSSQCQFGAITLQEVVSTHPPPKMWFACPHWGCHMLAKKTTKRFIIGTRRFSGKSRAGPQGSLKMAWVKGRVSGFGLWWFVHWPTVKFIPFWLWHAWLKLPFWRSKQCPGLPSQLDLMWGQNMKETGLGLESYHWLYMKHGIRIIIINSSLKTNYSPVSKRQSRSLPAKQEG